MHRIDRPAAAVRADALAERAVARADHRDAGRERLAHDDPERLRVRTGQQHDLDAGPVQQLGQQLVVVGAVRVQLGRRGLLQRAEVMDLDTRTAERLRELVHRVEALLRPAEPDERDAQRLVAKQAARRARSGGG